MHLCANIGAVHIDRDINYSFQVSACNLI